MPYCNTNPRFDEVLQRLGDLHDRKNAGYANAADPLANFRIANRFGITTSDSIAVRLSDKINRWLNLMEDRALDQVKETAEETMEDLVVYGMLWLVAQKEEDYPKTTSVNGADHRITVALTPEQLEMTEDFIQQRLQGE